MECTNVHHDGRKGFTFGADAGKSFLAIYSLDGDRLIFCAAEPGLERPMEFKTKPGHVLRINQREIE
jgi:hypothetical protein